MGRLEEAARELGRAAELAPTWPQPLEALSLVLCAYPQTSVYDPIRALELAERAVNLTKQRSPMALASLAAAQAMILWRRRAWRCLPMGCGCSCL